MIAFSAALLALALFVLVPALAESEENRIVSRAIDALTDYWKNEIYEGKIGDGYLEIKYTRVIYIADYAADNEIRKEIFDQMDGFVEFMLLSDFMGSAPFYSRIGTYEFVAFHKDGTFEVLAKSPLSTYTVRTYETDFSDIIERVSERDSDFNSKFSLLDD